MERFNDVKIKILHCGESVAVMAFCKQLLLESKLYHSLAETRLDTMEKVLKRA